MSLITNIIFLVTFFENFSFIEATLFKDVNLTLYYSYTIAIIIISVFITLLFTCFAYITIQYLKKPPAYQFNEIPAEKSDFSPIRQIRPIITVPEVVSSIRQSLEEMGNAITPKH